ncbi:unnamed protein product [Durusdinium trenchii]|uniref:Uncharacterized protein n=1 Tax=Durusdinium trenchii TaxID=1381693 RepID=A0ABP0SGV9_9DINO
MRISVNFMILRADRHLKECPAQLGHQCACQLAPKTRQIRPAGTKMAGQKSLRQAEANSEENMSWPHGTPTSAWTDARGRHGPWTEGAQQQQRCTKHIDSLEKEAGVSSRRPRTWRQRRGGTT